MGAVNALELHLMGAELVEQPQMAAFANVVVIHRAKHRAKRIGVEHIPLPAAVFGMQANRLQLVDIDLALEKPTGVARVKVPQLLPIERKGADELGIGNKGAQHPVATDFV